MGATRRAAWPLTPLSPRIGVRTHDDAGRPGVEQQQGADKEGAGQQDADGQQEPVAQANVLLPEEEGVAAGVAQHPVALGGLPADGPHALNRLHKVGCATQPAQVEGELGELQRLGCRDWGGEHGQREATGSTGGQVAWGHPPMPGHQGAGEHVRRRLVARRRGFLCRREACVVGGHREQGVSLQGSVCGAEGEQRGGASLR